MGLLKFLRDSLIRDLLLGSSFLIVNDWLDILEWMEFQAPRWASFLEPAKCRDHEGRMEWLVQSSVETGTSTFLSQESRNVSEPALNCSLQLSPKTPTGVYCNYCSLEFFFFLLKEIVGLRIFWWCQIKCVFSGS